MRVFSQINNCQQKQNKKKTKQKQKTDKTKRGAPLLGLAKSIYYSLLKLYAMLIIYAVGVVIYQFINVIVDITISLVSVQ